MEKKKPGRFYWRAVISFYIIISFLIMGISGIILFFAPPGRIAYWSDWRFIELTKTQWQAIHTLFTFLFIIMASFHIYFNWRVILTYIKQKVSGRMKRRNELLIASLLGILVAAVAIGNYPPSKTIMQWGEELSESWSDDATEPPVPHAELLSIQEFTGLIKMDYQELLSKLNNKNLKLPDENSTVKELADLNQLTPKDIYEIIQTNEEKNTHTVGSGYGRKTLEELCSELNIDLGSAITALSGAGIDAEPDARIKAIALANSILPVDIVNIINSKVQLE